MHGTPEISVVVGTRNRAGRLEGLLRTLRAQTLDRERFEVVMVNDGSTDRTAQILEAAAADGELRIEIVDLGGEGLASARNAGLRVARAPLAAFTDDDCEPPADWLQTALAEAAEHPGAVIQGPTTPIPREVEHIGPFTRTKLITEQGPSFQTCNIVYPREVLDDVGGFDEGYVAWGGEDTDLAWRAKGRGARFVWTENLRMHHAVDDLGPADFLRTALRGADTASVFRRHPGLRAQIRWGRVRHPSTPSLVFALAALLVLRHSRIAAVVLALPYARHLARTCASQNASLLLAPYYALRDVLVTFTALRGSIRHRTLVL